MKKIIKNPKDCNDAEIASFEELVTEGGEVALAGLRERILRAEKLVFIYDDNCVVVAIGAIKHPNTGYKSAIFEKSGVSGQEEYEFEVGWLYVSKTGRGKGYGRILMKSISQLLPDKTCFATTRENNTAMHYLFGQFGFSKIGNSYRSSNGNYSLTLYLKK